MNNQLNHRLFFLILVLASRLALAEVGFASGNEMTSTSAAGEVQLTCVSGTGAPPQTVSFQCRESFLSPQDHDYFLGPQNIEADQVELIVKRADGSVRTKQVKYNSVEGTSEAKFNLWTNSILQWPLLSLGENIVTYKLSLSGQVIHQGEFTAIVKTGEFNQCEPTHFYSNNPVDCSQPYSYCQRLFREKNYCR